MNALLLAAACYIGAFGNLDFPQGGEDGRLLAGAGVRAGAYADDESYFAVEGEGSFLEGSYGVSARCLAHWQAWGVYGDLFGYSRVDPFFTLGARGVFGGKARMAGPEFGAGTFYHLDESWSFRADASAALDVDSGAAMRYVVTVGLQRIF